MLTIKREKKKSKKYIPNLLNNMLEQLEPALSALQQSFEANPKAAFKKMHDPEMIQQLIDKLSAMDVEERRVVIANIFDSNYDSFLITLTGVFGNFKEDVAAIRNMDKYPVIC
jgi:hypothetical protein